MRFCLCGIAMAILLANGILHAATVDDTYYNDPSKHGYYWYENPEDKEPEKPKAKKKNQIGRASCRERV